MKNPSKDGTGNDESTYASEIAIVDDNEHTTDLVWELLVWM